MATLPTLLAAGALEEVEMDLPTGARIVRHVYAFPHVVAWLSNTLPRIQTEAENGDLTPEEQVFGRLQEFIMGARLHERRKAHCMLPEDSGVWTIKTYDVRLYGWFYRPRIFIIASATTKANLVAHPGMATGFVSETIQRRHRLDLDDPKFTTGDYDDVF